MGDFLIREDEKNRLVVMDCESWGQWLYEFDVKGNKIHTYKRDRICEALFRLETQSVSK